MGRTFSLPLFAKNKLKFLMVNLKEKACSTNISRKQLNLPARYSSLNKVRNFVVQAAEECGMEKDSIDAVELAVDEAFSNIIEHAYGGESHEQIECSCEDTSDRLIIVLKDCGIPFDPTSVPEPDLDASLEDRRVGGLGMYFMSQLMDEVHYSFTTGPGGRKNCNALTMVKYKEK